MKNTTIVLFLIFLSSIILANEFNWGWEEPNLNYNGIYEYERVNSAKDNFYNKLIRHYRKSESPWRGTHCPCFPSCSTFTLYSLNKYGFFIGFIMGIDRIFFRENFNLINCSFYYPIERTNYIDQQLKSGIYDPPEANNVFKKKDWRVINPYYYFISERNSSSTN